MDFKELLRKGLLGYQPIFFPNGVITGTGYQFFGNFRQAASSQVVSETDEGEFADSDSIRFNRGCLGNLYVPPELGGAEEFNTDCYYCIDDDELPQFVSDNLLLKRVYEHFVSQALEKARAEKCPIDSMLEVGSNTCLFPIEFARRGVRACHGADIVDYSDVVAVLAALNDAPVSFHHMRDDSSESWQQLPKVDLVWSYAVVLHQANPLVHLTRLASKARKAIFVMTNCGEDDAWGSPLDMAIKYQSANSYYAAPFPNCFDVSIVSPELLRFSLQRLGFSRVFELTCPAFDHSSQTECEHFVGWMKAHRFFLALRDEPLSDYALDDYSVETERSPYNGQDIRVYRGNHNNVFLKNGRYFVVPHDRWIAKDFEQLCSFGSLSRAISYLEQLEAEVSPFPILIREIEGHALMRYRNSYYLCPDGARIDFNCERDLEKLHLLDSYEKWTSLLDRMGVSSLLNLEWVIRDLINDVCVVRTPSGHYVAHRMGADGAQGEVVARASSFLDARRSVIVAELVGPKIRSEMATKICYCGDVKALERGPEGFHIRCLDSGEIISDHLRYEDAWLAFLGTVGRIGS